MVVKENMVFWLPQLHLQNDCNDSTGVGGEDCGGGEVITHRF